MSTWKAFIVIMKPTVGVNEAVRNWTAGTLPCATPIKPANICKGGDKQLLYSQYKMSGGF